MFEVQKRKTTGGTIGKWFPILHTEDGHDAADYLRQCVENEKARSGGEYRLIFTPKKS